MHNIQNEIKKALYQTSSIPKKIEQFFTIRTIVLCHKSDPKDEKYTLSNYDEVEQSIIDLFDSFWPFVHTSWNDIREWENVAGSFLKLALVIFENKISDYKQVEGYKEFMEEVWKQNAILQKDPRHINGGWDSNW